MIPIIGEDYGYGFGTSYFAVAVVKKSNKDIKFTNLKGKKSCHTGAGKTAGWNVPIGTLLKMKLMMPDESCNPYVAAGNYFSESCVPSKITKFVCYFSFITVIILILLRICFHCADA